MKKSQIYFMFIFSLIVVMIIVPFALIVADKKQKKFDKSIGDAQLAVLKTYEKGEKVLYYIDDSARIAFMNSLHHISKNGLGNECGRFEDFPLWSTPNITCFPQKQEFYNLVANDMSFVLAELLNNYEGMPALNYDIEIQDNKQTGLTADRVFMQINLDEIIRLKDTTQLSQEEIEQEIAQSFRTLDEIEIIGYYTINPSFLLTTNILEIFDHVSKARNLHAQIKDEAYLTKFDVYAIIDEYDGWNINSCEPNNDDTIINNTLKICINTNIIHLYYDEDVNQFVNGPIHIKFALMI